jgi:hypothetical protein
MAPRPFKLYWSNIEAFEECPQRFLWKRGYGTIDVGGGPGRPKPIPQEERSSEHHALMGTVIAATLERLYNDELWREPATLATTLTEIVRKEFSLEIPRRYLKYAEGREPQWNESPPHDALIQVCLDGVINYLKTMKRNRMLGPYARAEVDLSTVLDKDVPIAGRPDLIVRRDDTGLSIYDGKNSLNPGKYTNPDQLRWYALCFYLAYHTVPNRLAFIYFRYPEGSPPKDYAEDPETWTGLVEIPFQKDDLKIIAHRARETYKAITKEYFDPTPSPKACRFCDYQSVCDARKATVQIRTKRPKSEAESVIESSSGMVEFGMGDGFAKSKA